MSSKANVAMVGSEGVYIWRGCLVYGAQFCVGAFVRNPASVAVNVFSILICIAKFYEVCSFNAILEDNAAINCINVRDRKDLFSSILTYLHIS